MTTMGRPSTIEITAVRPLVREDLVTLTTVKRTPTTLSRLRESHHMIARLFAAGWKQKDIAERTGYSPTRISTLYADPAMKELISNYTAKINEGLELATEDFAAVATANMILAETLLRDKLLEAAEGGDDISTRELAGIVADRADRFGFGKRQTTVNLNVDFASQLDRAIARSRVSLPESPRLSAIDRFTPRIKIIEHGSDPTPSPTIAPLLIED